MSSISGTHITELLNTLWSANHNVSPVDSNIGKGYCLTKQEFRRVSFEIHDIIIICTQKPHIKIKASKIDRVERPRIPGDIRWNCPIDANRALKCPKYWYRHIARCHRLKNKSNLRNLNATQIVLVRAIESISVAQGLVVQANASRKWLLMERQ